MAFRGCCDPVCRAVAEAAGVVPDELAWPATLFSILDILFRAFWIISISCCVSHIELLIKPVRDNDVSAKLKQTNFPSFCLVVLAVLRDNITLHNYSKAGY